MEYNFVQFIQKRKEKIRPKTLSVFKSGIQIYHEDMTDGYYRISIDKEKDAIAFELLNNHEGYKFRRNGKNICSGLKLCREMPLGHYVFMERQLNKFIFKSLATSTNK